MQQNNNLSVLPWYSSINEQNHRKPYAYDTVYPLYCPLGAIPPFQFIREHNGATIYTVQLVELHNGNSVDITSAIVSAGMQVKQFAAYHYDIVMYPSIAPQNITTELGQFYLVTTMNDGAVYYSDVFTVVDSSNGYLSVQWWDYEDLVMDGSRIVYSDNYRNTLWLQTMLGKPEYEFEEEGEQRDGYFFPEKMISQKRFKCVILAPEYLCDVMRFIRLSDNIRVQDQYGNIYRCDTFLITPEWQQQGDLASVEIEFTCDTVAKKIGRGIITGSHDFNDDYNNDFDITTNQ